MMVGTTVTQFLIEEQRRFPSATGDLTLVLRDIVTACKAMAVAMRQGRLADDDLFGSSAAENVHGETQKTLDLLAHDLFFQRITFGGHVAGIVSEELDSPWFDDEAASGRYLLLFDPVDGSTNIGEDAAIGTIFSVLRRADEATGQPELDEFLQPGWAQVCAGYAIYGPACMLVLTTGNGVNGFTLDPSLGEFLLTNPEMTIPDAGTRLCVNVAHRDRWPPGIARYIDDLGGRLEQRGSSFDVRWSGCAVADVHRVLVSGGIYLGPVVATAPGGDTIGKLRLLYEVNPLGMLAEQAGGTAIDGHRRVLDVVPTSVHQALPVVIGSRHEVANLVDHYLDESPEPTN